MTAATCLLPRIRRSLPHWAYVLLSVVCLLFSTQGGSIHAGQPTPCPNAHAHNDYLHDRPLLDALQNGFCSVEADIYLIAGELLVAHDREKVNPSKTLRALYLDPLQARVKENDGSVFQRGTEFTLLIDIKSEAEATYQELKRVLVPFHGMLTAFGSNAIRTNAVTIILSGNRPVETVAKEPMRYVAIDGRLPDLDLNSPLALIPLVSADWSKTFQTGRADFLNEADRIRLAAIVKQCHQQKRKLRFWGAPDEPAAWRMLREANVDLINTDKLAELSAFLTHR